MNPLRDTTILKYDELAALIEAGEVTTALIFMEDAPNGQDVEDLTGVVELLKGAEMTIVCDEMQAKEVATAGIVAREAIFVENEWNGHNLPSAVVRHFQNTERLDLVITTLAYDGYGAYVKRPLERALVPFLRKHDGRLLLHDPHHRYLRIVNADQVHDRVSWRPWRKRIYKLAVYTLFGLVWVVGRLRPQGAWVKTG